MASGAGICRRQKQRSSKNSQATKASQNKLRSSASASPKLEPTGSEETTTHHTPQDRNPTHAAERPQRATSIPRRPHLSMSPKSSSTPAPGTFQASNHWVDLLLRKRSLDCISLWFTIRSCRLLQIGPHAHAVDYLTVCVQNVLTSVLRAVETERSQAPSSINQTPTFVTAQSPSEDSLAAFNSISPLQTTHASSSENVTDSVSVTPNFEPPSDREGDRSIEDTVYIHSSVRTQQSGIAWLGALGNEASYTAGSERSQASGPKLVSFRSLQRNKFSSSIVDTTDSMAQSARQPEQRKEDPRRARKGGTAGSVATGRNGVNSGTVLNRMLP